MTKLEFVQTVVEGENEIQKATNDQEEQKELNEQLEQQIVALHEEIQDLKMNGKQVSDGDE